MSTTYGQRARGGSRGATDKTGKGSVRFPLDQPLPAALIRRIVEFRVEETAGKGSGYDEGAARVGGAPDDGPAGR